MAMATGDNALVTEHQKLSFVSGIDQAFQQMTPEVMPYFDSTTVDGEFAFFDRIGVADDLRPDNQRYGYNPVSEIPHDRRRVNYSTNDGGKLIDRKDLWRVVQDPTDAYNVAMVASVHRQQDRTVINNIFGPAYTGQNGSTVVNFVAQNANAAKITVGNISSGNPNQNPITTAGNYVVTDGDYEGIDVASDYLTSGTHSGLTLMKLRAVKKTMRRLFAVKRGELIDCFVTEAQADQLLGIEEIINADYAMQRALEEGDVARFMGFRFIRSELLLGAGTSTSPRQVICSTARSGKYVLKELRVDLWNDSSRKNIPYGYVALTDGFSRFWGENTARVNCLD